MSEGMNEEKAREIVSQTLGGVEIQPETKQDALSSFEAAVGYLERVEQEKAVIERFQKEHAEDWERMNEYRKALEAADRLLISAMKVHPHSKLIASQLESGELKRRLDTIGPSFDPDGIVRAILDYRAARAKLDVKGEKG